MKRLIRQWGFFPIVIVSLVGCAPTTSTVDSRQADIGLGIVEGTKGIRQLQEDTKVEGTFESLRGQVVRIEGGAYVVRLMTGAEARLPLDENTRIDRPAHIGDWIEARLDHRGRARHIRNVDDQMILGREN